jgi:hypothetical protein
MKKQIRPFLVHSVQNCETKPSAGEKKQTSSKKQSGRCMLYRRETTKFICFIYHQKKSHQSVEIENNNNIIE